MQPSPALLHVQPRQVGHRQTSASGCLDVLLPCLFVCTAACRASHLMCGSRLQRSDRDMQQLQQRLQQTEQSQQQVLHVLTQAMRDPSFLQQLVAGRPTQFLTDGTEAGPDGTGGAPLAGMRWRVSSACPCSLATRSLLDVAAPDLVQLCWLAPAGSASCRCSSSRPAHTIPGLHRGHAAPLHHSQAISATAASA